MRRRTDLIPLPLYHGTSTLFLEGILKHGLGGKNQLEEWRVLELARAIAPLVEQHCAIRDDLMVKASGFRWMTEQLCEAMNFQHGHSYVSPSIATAARYAISNRYGSELLTYTLDFLQELSGMGVRGVNDELYRRFPELFEKLRINPAPLLIRIDDVPFEALLTERGEQPDSHVKIIGEMLRESDHADAILQQINFRLVVPQAVSSASLINVKRPDPHFPEYTLHELADLPSGDVSSHGG
jgi:hypothetical protein